MSITKWKTNISQWSGGDKIERVECTRETESSVWVLEDTRSWYDEQEGKPPKFVERRRNKGADYHDSWQAAHECLLKDAERRLENARAALAKAQAHHGNVKGMKEPTV